MSAYFCNSCDEYCDADFHGCNESPDNEFDCICDSCLETLIGDKYERGRRRLTMNAYYAQWSHAEIMSMHGVEKDDDGDEYHEKDDIDLEPIITSYDLDMLTWRDFL